MNILVAVAHVDDELTCGGTLNKWESRDGIRIEIWAFSDRKTQPDPSNKMEFLASLCKLLPLTKEIHYSLFEYKTGYFPGKHQLIRNDLERVKERFKPDIVFTHSPHDLMQDHRTVAEEVRSVFRTNTVLAGELGNSETPEFTPNYYVTLSKDNIEAKVKAAAEYPLENHKHYMQPEHFWGLARYRGTQIRSETQFAEAFELWRMVEH